MDKDSRSQIFQLLFVVFAGIAAAVVIMGGMLYSWSPSGTYLAKNVLLAPEVTSQMAFKDEKRNSFTFDHFDFTYFEGGKIQKVKVSAEKYAAFYAMVGGDRSYSEVDPAVTEKFSLKSPASLVVTVRDKNAESTFQEINFIDDYYRVEIHQEVTEWAYFYHSGIYQEVHTLFVE